MQVITLTIVCRNGDEGSIAHEMMNSDIAQLGLHSWGTSIRCATPKEEKEVVDQTPPKMLNKGETDGEECFDCGRKIDITTMVPIPLDDEEYDTEDEYCAFLCPECEEKRKQKQNGT